MAGELITRDIQLTDSNSKTKTVIKRKAKLIQGITK